MKKILAVLFVFVITMSLFVGCDSKSKVEETTESEEVITDEPATEEPTTEEKEYIYLEDSGLLKIDTSILDLSYDETEETLDLDLAPLKAFNWWGNNLKSVDTKYNGLNLTLLFQDNSLVMVMYDSGVEGAWDAEVYAAAQDEYTEIKEHVFKVDSRATYDVLSDELLATGQTVFRQRYTSTNMY